MNEFLDQVWFDNTLRSYIVVAIVILFIIIVKRYVAKYVAVLIFQFVRSIWKDVEKRPFIALVAQPLGFFLAVFISVIALNKLVFPHQLNVDIYHVTVKELAHGLGRLAIILSFVRLMIRMIDFISLILTIRADKTEDTTDNQLIVFFKDFFKVILVIIGILMIMKYTFGYNISNLLTGLSIVGAAIALALRESLENLIASFIIFLDKPFKAGDTVKVHNFSGSVEKVGLRSTRIRTDQKTFITVPNKQMVDSILDNLSLRTHRKGELRLEISLSTSSEAIEELIKEARGIIAGRKDISSVMVFLNDITPSAFQVAVDYFTGPVTLEEFNKIKEGINLSVLKLMEKMEIGIAGAVTDIKLTGSNETPGN